MARSVSLNLLRKRLVIERIFEYNGSMEFGGPTAECAERSALDAVLDEAQQVLSKMIDILAAGGLDQLDAAQKVAFWQRFETFRNRLPERSWTPCCRAWPHSNGTAK